MDEKTFELHYLPGRMKYINSSAVYHVYGWDETRPYDDIVQGVVDYGLQRFYEDSGDKEYEELTRKQKIHLDDMIYLHASYLTSVEFRRRFDNEQDD